MLEPHSKGSRPPKHIVKVGRKDKLNEILILIILFYLDS